MSSTALDSNDHAKLFIFSLAMLPPTVFLVGLVPTLFIVFGIVMMKRSRDFSHIETAVRNTRIYIWLFVIGCSILAVDAYLNPDTYWSAEHTATEVLFRAGFAALGAAYLVMLNYFFLKPLRNHQEWVAANGFFAGKDTNHVSNGAAKDIDIIKGERLRSFSVADELMKWAKLKEDGHITEAEFSEARAKLLQRS